jgi:hypothetical protein
MRDYIAFAFLAFVTKIDGVEHQLLEFRTGQRKSLPAAFSIRPSALADVAYPAH